MFVNNFNLIFIFIYIECQRFCLRVDVVGGKTNLVFMDHGDFHDPIKFMSEINKQIKVSMIIHYKREKKKLIQLSYFDQYINIYQKFVYSYIFLIIRGSLLLSTIKFPKSSTRSMS